VPGLATPGPGQTRAPVNASAPRRAPLADAVPPGGGMKTRLRAFIPPPPSRVRVPGRCLEGAGRGSGSCRAVPARRHPGAPGTGRRGPGPFPLRCQPGTRPAPACM